MKAGSEGQLPPFARIWPTSRPDTPFRPAVPEWHYGAVGAPLPVAFPKSSGQGEIVGGHRY